MSTPELINWLSVLVLAAFLVASIFLIVLLYRANRMLYKLDHLSETFRSFVADIVPAIVNVGTVATAVQAILRTLAEHHIEIKNPKKK